MKKTAKPSPKSKDKILLISTALVVLVTTLAIISVYTAVELRQFKISADERIGLLYNELDYQKSLQRPVVVAPSNQVLFPELKIALPYNDITKTLQYSGGQDGSIGLTSTMINDHAVRQLSCSQLVSVQLKDRPLYSPWEEKAGSVKLSDGRTLYLFASKAFKNNEASTAECASEVWRPITPQQVANEFKQAHAY